MKEKMRISMAPVTSKRQRINQGKVREIVYGLAPFTQLFSTIGFLITIGYWRAAAVGIGWRFCITPGWWCRFILSLFVMGISCLLTEDNLREVWRELWNQERRMTTTYWSPTDTLEEKHPRIATVILVMMLVAILWSLFFCRWNDLTYGTIISILSGVVLLMYSVERILLAIYAIKIRHIMRWLQ